ncbi:MAG: hypothetical protein LC632_07770 [Xanthomonadaceae bacterium]|nr:hypothetical protein [Xanthomonadaceae bacterium]
MNRRLSIIVLVLAVLVVQFGVVQHSIEHGAPFPDAGCEVCVAGVHYGTVDTVTTNSPPDLYAASSLVPQQVARRAAKVAAAHRVRAPPILA